jgi:hypothetical protein
MCIFLSLCQYYKIDGKKFGNRKTGMMKFVAISRNSGSRARVTPSTPTPTPADLTGITGNSVTRLCDLGNNCPKSPK